MSEQALQTVGGFDLLSMADVDVGRFLSQIFSAESLAFQPKSIASSGNPKAALRIGVIPITGVLTKYGSDWGSSSDAIGNMVEAAANSGQFDALMLRADSPGGMTAGVYESNAKIVAAAKKMPIHAHVDGLGASAALPFMAPAQRITLTKGSLMGSMGTYSTIDDSTKLFEQMGVTRTVVKAGEHKADGMPGTRVTEKQIAERQRIVDAMNEHFIAAMAEGRNLPMATVRAMADGRIHVGQAAVDAGFADAVSTFDEAMASLADAVLQKAPTKGRKTMSQDTNAGPAAATLAELKAAFPSSDAAFRESCLESNMTIAAAHQAFALAQRDNQIATLSASIEAKDAEIAKLKADLATEQSARTVAEDKLAKVPTTTATITRPGVAPLSTTTTTTISTGDGSAKADWDAHLKQVKADHPNFDNMKAVVFASTANPDLYERMIDEVNQRA